MVPLVRPRLRPGVGAALDQMGRLRLIFFGESRHVIFEAHPAVVDTLRALEHASSIDDLLGRVRSSHPAFTSTDLDEILQALQDEHALTDEAIDGSASIPEDDRAVFQRQIDFLHDLATAEMPIDRLHNNIRRSTVAVVGVGGTGSWMAQSLAMIGVSRLRLIDPDTVEPSNLSRQALFTPEDVGRPKVEAARDHLMSSTRNAISVEPCKSYVSDGDSLAPLIEGSDLVINCADQPDINVTSDWVSQACMAFRTPHIVAGAYSGHTGLIGPTIVPYETACWQCFRGHEEERREDVKMDPILEHRTRHTAAIAPLAAIVANIQVWDAIRVVSGLGAPVLANRLGELDLNTMQLTWRRVPRDGNCPRCSEGRSS